MRMLKSKKTGVYSAVIHTAHGPRALSTGQKSLPEARKIARRARLREIEAHAKSGSLTQHAISNVLTGSRLTMAKAAEEWAAWLRSTGKPETTIYQNTAKLRHWIEHQGLARKSPASITEEDISPWVNRPGDAKLGTRMTGLSVVTSFFNFCAAKGWRSGNPAKLAPVNLNKLDHRQKEKRQRAPFTAKQVDALLAATDGFWHAAIALSRWTGLRIGDIAQLEWDCFAKKGRMVVWTDKRDRRVDLPITQAEAAKWMRECGVEMTDEISQRFERMERQLMFAISRIDSVDPKLCFPDERAKYRDISKSSWFSVTFSRICAAQEILGHTFHDLRATFATECRKLGIPMPHIANVMGHASTRTTEGYVKE